LVEEKRWIENDLWREPEIFSPAPSLSTPIEDLDSSDVVEHWVFTVFHHIVCHDRREAGML